ncbi:MAG: ChbG/HpnK family deacetylase [Candidatus Moranbacteria bacterium]|nr:ChbG/HpnK family deacetylase [Candidatus Moranbacteria bacterium]
MFHKKRKNLIVAADDFGKSELANLSILKLAKLGKLDRVSVMSDGNFAPGEIEELITTGVKLDIHLELDWQKKRRDILKAGALKRGINFFLNYFRADSEHRAKQVLREYEDQIEKFRKIFGCLPNGINSHEYVHYFPPYFRVALELAKKFDIPYVRFAMKGILRKKNIIGLTLIILRRLDKKIFLESGLKSSDYFSSLDWIGNTDYFLKNIPEGKTEIACHPEREEEFELVDKYF